MCIYKKCYDLWDLYRLLLFGTIIYVPAAKYECTCIVVSETHGLITLCTLHSSYMYYESWVTKWNCSWVSDDGVRVVVSMRVPVWSKVPVSSDTHVKFKFTTLHSYECKEWRRVSVGQPSVCIRCRDHTSAASRSPTLHIIVWQDWRMSLIIAALHVRDITHSYPQQ